MQTKTIESLNKKLALNQDNAAAIEAKLQTAWNKVFSKSKVIKDIVSKFDSSNEYTFDKWGEISSYIRFYDLKDFRECRVYFETYMQDMYSISVDWDNDCLLMNQGECLIIQDDTRRDNGIWLNQKLVIPEDDYTDLDETGHKEVNEVKRNELIEAYMKKTGFYPGVFRVDSYSNITHVKTTK